MNRVPGGIEPWNLVGEKLQEIENASDGNDPRVSEHFERLILLGERDPMEMDRKSGNKNGQIKVDASQAGQA